MYKNRLNKMKDFRYLQPATGGIILISMLAAILVSVLLVSDQLILALVLPAALIAVPLLGKPMLILGVVTFMAPIYWLPGITPGLYEAVRDTFFILYFFSIILTLLLKRIKLSKIPSKSGLAILGIILFSMLSGVVFSPEPARSLIYWLKTFQVVFFYVSLLLLIESPEDAWHLLLIFLAAQAFSVGMLWFETIVAWIGYTPPWTVPFPHIDRGEVGLLYRRTAFSGTTAHTIPIILGIIAGLKVWKNNTIKKGGGYALLAAFIGAILISHGRGGLLAALIVIAWAIWRYSRKTFFLFGVGIITLAVMFPSVLMEPFINKAASNWVFAAHGWRLADRLTGYRLGNYIMAFSTIFKYPMGVGLGLYSSVVESSSQEMISNSLGLEWHVASSPHNLYLDVGSEAGVAAGLSVTLFGFWVIHKLWKAVRRYSDSILIMVFAGVIIAQLITSLFEVEIFSTIYRAFPFWISLAAIVKFYSKGTPVSSTV